MSLRHPVRVEGVSFLHSIYGSFFCASLICEKNILRVDIFWERFLEESDRFLLPADLSWKMRAFRFIYSNVVSLSFLGGEKYSRGKYSESKDFASENLVLRSIDFYYLGI